MQAAGCLLFCTTVGLFNHTCIISFSGLQYIVPPKVEDNLACEIANNLSFDAKVGHHSQG